MAVVESISCRPVSECQLPKLDVAGSIPVSRSWFQEFSLPAIPAVSNSFHSINDSLRVVRRQARNKLQVVIARKGAWLWTRSVL
jgi:hypothetical protein